MRRFTRSQAIYTCSNTNPLPAEWALRKLAERALRKGENPRIHCKVTPKASQLQTNFQYFQTLWLLPKLFKDFSRFPTDFFDLLRHFEGRWGQGAGHPRDPLVGRPPAKWIPSRWDPWREASRRGCWWWFFEGGQNGWGYGEYLWCILFYELII